MFGYITLQLLGTGIETSDKVGRQTFTGVIDSSLLLYDSKQGQRGFIYNQFSK